MADRWTRTDQAEVDQVLALESPLLTGYRAAKFVGVVSYNFDGWAWRYGVEPVNEDGTPYIKGSGERKFYRTLDVREAKAKRDDNIARTNPHL